MRPRAKGAARPTFTDCAARYVAQSRSIDVIKWHVTLLQSYIGDLEPQQIHDQALEPLRARLADGASATTINGSLEVVRTIEDRFRDGKSQRRETASQAHGRAFFRYSPALSVAATDRSGPARDVAGVFRRATCPSEVGKQSDPNVWSLSLLPKSIKGTQGSPFAPFLSSRNRAFWAELSASGRTVGALHYDYSATRPFPQPTQHR